MRKRSDAKIKNTMKLVLPSLSVNEGMARAAVSAFCSQLDPTGAELADIKCAISEAVTNCIVHAYRDRDPDTSYIYISVRLYDCREISVEISDNGCGIADVALARSPAYTTGETGERCGMGFLVMESFTDFLSVKSKSGRGTTVLMRKILKS